MTENLVMPFGKYRGQPAQSVLVDPNYLQWMTSQPGLMQKLRERHIAIFNLITLGAPENNDTPEHNRIQVRFTDPKFRAAFVSAFYCRSWFDFPQRWNMKIPLETKAHFECGYDVHLDIKNNQSRSVGNGLYSDFLSFKIEIKPLMGDDFPSVLRQVRQNKANVLLLEEFNSQSATFDQIKTVFKTVPPLPLDRIRYRPDYVHPPACAVMMLSEIEEWLTKLEQEEHLRSQQLTLL